MIKVENIDVFNFENAIRGMRNAKESWNKSDSYWTTGNMYVEDDYYSEFPIKYIIGKNDMELALKLIKAGNDHSKFLRQIFISMDITAPLYWWKEADTYKIATVANSTSTMHKLSSTPITKECFSFDEYTERFAHYQLNLINQLETLRLIYNETKDVDVWRALIQLLPSAWNQKRTWSANYSVLRNIYFARKNHKLSEWHDFCKVIEKLPYSELITVEKE